MKKFKIEYGIVREYDEVTLWFEPIDDDLDALVLRNRSGRFFRYSQSRGKKEEKEATEADAIGLLETARSGRGGNAELPWRAGWPPRKGEQYGTIFPMGAAGSRPAGQSCPGELGGHQERGAQTDVSPWEWLDTRPARSCQAGNAELPTDAH